MKEQIRDLLRRQRRHFSNHLSSPLPSRIAALEKLLVVIRDHEEAILSALKSDLKKPELEALISETGSVTGEIKYALKHLDEWCRPKRVNTPLLAQPGKAFLTPEPKGVVLVLSPWNYPFSLSLNPVVAALAAGNCVVLKPSELAPATSKILHDLIEKNFSPDHLACLEGDHHVAESLLKERFEHIFFTGSPNVGKKIMAAAAKHLCPVTLELGGKSPCLVDAFASMDVAVRRIVWGKFFNAGQTCVAPDYVLVHESQYQRFLGKLKDRIHTEFGDDPSLTDDYGRIINERHFDRLLSYMSDGKLLCGGDFKKGERYIAPTVLTDVSLDSSIMNEEIFGPILPVIPYGQLDTAVEIIRARPNPLALYLFTEDKNVEDYVLSSIPAGCVCINDTLMQAGFPELPFGGRGESGMGAYHGKAGFDVFTHYKSVLRRSTLIDPNFRYRPYEKHVGMTRWFFN